MKSTRKTTHLPSKKALIIAGSAVVLVLGLLAIYVFALGGSLFGWQPTKQASSNSSQTTKTTTPTQTETPATTGESTNNSVKNTTPDTSGGASTPAANTLTITFTHWSTTSVGVLIEGVVNGTCTLTLTKPGNTTVTMTAATFQSGASSSTCQGFNYDEVPGGGWTATVTVKTNDATGSASQAIE